MTQRLDAGAGWYGEFLRRDPEGVRACLNGAAIPPWDVVESLLRDLAGAGGAELAARETVYAARLRAAAVTVWDRLPGGEDELRTLLVAAAAQRAESEAALRSLTARLGEAADRAETDALTRELSWTQDDVARAAARHEDLAARLTALRADPLPTVPRQRSPHAPQAEAPTGPAEPQLRDGAPTEPAAPVRTGPLIETPPGAGGNAQSAAQAGPWPVAPAPTGPRAAEPRPQDAPEQAAVLPPVGRAEGRWLRGARRSGGARYAGATAPEAPAFTPPPGHADTEARPAPRGARFGRHRPEPQPEPQPEPPPQAAPAPAAAPAPPTRPPRAVAAELLALRAQGRTGEAHALLCQAAAWPAGQLPHLAAELARAGLAADWNTLLWEAASLPPVQLAAAAAALGEAGREADCDALLRQGVSRPAAEVADAALALGAAGRTREADALLGAFVRVRTAEEAAALARHDPQWFTPRLLHAAGLLSGARHRDLVHALRVAGIVPA
ncbi:hypothetical protein ABZY83_25055 [Streptomyces virginiae]|uniref:hypothetical protein n=1 Tax=Streptomyces TaxID=1883 RepID=UPI00131AECB4|nr:MULTISPECIES: hypothetical protein [unclassified Streptomyces]